MTKLARIMMGDIIELFWHFSTESDCRRAGIEKRWFFVLPHLFLANLVLHVLLIIYSYSYSYSAFNVVFVLVLVFSRHQYTHTRTRNHANVLNPPMSGFIIQ